MTKSGRLKEMRKAFSQRDVQASALLHSPENIAQTAKEQHGGASDLYIGTDYTRIDFRISQDLKPYIIDINPTPSLEDNSFFASCAYLANYTYNDLIKEIIDAGFSRNSLV